jgi:hypothetical protein
MKIEKGILSEIHLWKITLKIGATKNTALILYRGFTVNYI